MLALIHALHQKGMHNIEVYGFDTDPVALERAYQRIKAATTGPVMMKSQSFLDYVLSQGQDNSGVNNAVFDIAIANPPYVRTQLLGAETSAQLVRQFGLSGRVDLYHAFVLAIGQVLDQGAVLGIIIPNRFMTIKSGEATRRCFLNRYELLHIWDLGDSKLFKEAVLPSIVLAYRTDQAINDAPKFTRIHSQAVKSGRAKKVPTILDALERCYDGAVAVEGSQFDLVSGVLKLRDVNDVWSVSTNQSRRWLQKVSKNTYCTFSDVGKIRVGVKSTADKVFIRHDWDELGEDLKPETEVLRPLITHKQTRRWKPETNGQPRILYTHDFQNGKRCVIDLYKYPSTRAYLNQHRAILAGRQYVKKAGRNWFEIWVPHNPELWQLPKLVFRDIAERSAFCIDTEGCIVNGDCYWMVCEKTDNSNLLWLAAAVANSSFILKFYDEKFHNKLYANRRRFMSQYVQQFPLPDPQGDRSNLLISLAKKAYDAEPEQRRALESRMDSLVWEIFTL